MAMDLTKGWGRFVRMGRERATGGWGVLVGVLMLVGVILFYFLGGGCCVGDDVVLMLISSPTTMSCF